MAPYIPILSKVFKYALIYGYLCNLGHTGYGIQFQGRIKKRQWYEICKEKT